jgi:hypothetical protein
MIRLAFCAVLHGFMVTWCLAASLVTALICLPHERICFASSYFLPGFFRFLLFLDCDPQPKQLSDTISGNICTKRHPSSIFP